LEWEEKVQEIIPCFPAARLIWTVRAGKEVEEVVFIARKATYQVVRIVDKIKSSRQIPVNQGRCSPDRDMSKGGILYIRVEIRNIVFICIDGKMYVKR
jgi:hypothetical protein